MTVSTEPRDKFGRMQMVLEYLVVKPCATILEISQNTGLSYTSVKNILDELSSNGYVETDIQKESVGRPATVYRLKKPFMFIYPPRDYPLLTRALIKAFIKKYGNKELDTWVKVVGDVLGEDVIKCLRRKYGEEILTTDRFWDVLRDELNDMGMYCELKKMGKGKISIVIRNCIFQEIGQTLKGNLRDIPCRIHELSFSYIFSHFKPGKKVIVELKSTIIRDNDFCDFYITFKD
ncbi:MAG: winged helix-turn-helix transcriptional regulator [Candidatus Baldrarchaeota archaeon]